MKQHESLPLVPIERARGCWLYDFDGRRYLDAVSSWWVNLFGHANARINEAIARQLNSLEHAMLAGFTHEAVVELSERLSRLTSGALGHAFYGSDGASATEIALKMSFHYWRNRGRPRKNQFVSVAGGYHGETIGALSVTDVALFKSTYAPLLRESAQLPSPDWRLADSGETPRDFAERCAERLEQYLATNHENIAAFIVEPLVQGAIGMAMHHPHYIARAAEICSHYEVHLIADEIMTGFGRTGSFFAHEQAHITPDFLCLSKGITGGYLPLSVVLTRDAIYEAFYDDDISRGFLHSHSYSGNALACRAALATLEIFETDDVIETNRAKADVFDETAAQLKDHRRVRQFRHKGFIWAFDVVTDEPISRRIYAAALERELLLRPIGSTVYFMPPYTISRDEFELLVTRTIDILETL